MHARVKKQFNIVIDIIAFAAFICMISTGVIMRYLLPPGSHDQNIWGLNRHGWGDIHFWLSAIFFGILILHLILHWNWIISVIKGRVKESVGKRLGWGILGLVVLMALAFAPVISGLQSADQSAQTNEAHHTHLIKGSMTWNQLMNETNLTSSYFIENLGLPESPSGDEKLSFVLKSNNLEMSDLRSLVSQWSENNKSEDKSGG